MKYPLELQPRYKGIFTSYCLQPEPDAYESIRIPIKTPRFYSSAIKVDLINFFLAEVGSEAKKPDPDPYQGSNLDPDPC